MLSLSLRVGDPALPGAPRTSLEGGRIAFDGAVLHLVVAYDRPTRSEIRAVTHGPVDLGVYHRDGLAAVVVVAGDPRSPVYLEAFAPLVLDQYEGTSHTAQHGDELDALHVQLALCGASDTVVQAVRDLSVSRLLARTIRQAAHAQAERFGVAVDAVRAHETGLRTLTTDYLLRHAVARARVAGYCFALLCCG